MHSRLKRFIAWLFRRKPKRVFIGDSTQKPIEKYDDYAVIGIWATMSTETGEYLDSGKMMGRSVKYKDADGSVQMGHEWITDRDARKEKETG